MIDGQTIPTPEKVFSLIEPDTEMINRGKTPQPIEFGHRVLIVEDRAGFIVHARVMEPGQTDEKTPVVLMAELQSRFSGKIKAASFDKGFWSPSNLQELNAIVPRWSCPRRANAPPLIPSGRGPKSSAACASGMPAWRPIHALQAGNGLGVCRDKGIEGYQRFWPWVFWAATFSGWGSFFLRKERKRRREQMLMMAA